MKRILLMAAGLTLLGLGFIGVFLSILPTTPFILASAFCFSSSSPRAYRFIMKSKYFKAYIDNFRTKAGVPPAVKLRGILCLWFVLLPSVLLFNSLQMRLFLCVIGICVTLHLLMLKTKREDSAESGTVPEIFPPS